LKQLQFVLPAVKKLPLEYLVGAGRGANELSKNRRDSRVTEASLRQERLQNVARKSAACCHAERAVFTPAERDASSQPRIYVPLKNGGIVLSPLAPRAGPPDFPGNLGVGAPSGNTPKVIRVLKR